MAEQKKLDLWADKLLDTGKRNNLISFKDTKASTAEILFPTTQNVFSKCSVGHAFEVFDPKIPDMEIEELLGDESLREKLDGGEKLSREEYLQFYTPRMKSERYLLVYAQTPNPMTAVKSISKKALEMLDETGINAAHLAFGFLKWREKEGASTFYKAPLLLVHINIITGTIQEPVRIEVCDDDVVVNPTFNYYLQAEYGISLPEYEDGETLTSYYAKVQHATRGLGWEIVDECKIGIFSFLKLNMYEDLKQNGELILGNENVRALIGEEPLTTPADVPEETEYVVDNPLIDLHAVVDADSSQIKAIEMAKSGKSFVLQGPPGTGKSQTITNIIAERLYDGKKVLFVSEKRAALDVVFDKLRKAGLADFCLELHSHKANKKSVIAEINRILETPGTLVSSSAQEEIRQKREAQSRLDSYAAALHKTREPINRSLYELIEAYSGQRSYPEIPFTLRDIDEKGQDYLLRATHLLEQYAEYMASVGGDYHQNAWYGFTDTGLSFEKRTQLRSDLEALAQGYRAIRGTTKKVRAKYGVAELKLTDAKRWRDVLSFAAESDVVTPSLLSRRSLEYARPYIEQMRDRSNTIVDIRKGILEDYYPTVIQEIDGEELHDKLTGQFGSAFSRLFSGEYKKLIALLRSHVKDGEKIKYQQAKELAERLMRLKAAREAYEEAEKAVPGCLGRCYKGENTEWDHVLSELDSLRVFLNEDERPFDVISRMNPDDFSAGQDTFRADSEKLASEIDTIKEAGRRVAQQFSREVLDLETGGFDSCIEKIEGCIADFDKLGNWIAFTDLLEQIGKEGLTPFVDLMIEYKIPPEAIPGTFRRGFYKQWIENILFSVPELASFTRIRQDQAVQNFARKDRLQYEINKAEIASKLSQKRPNLDLIAGGSAVAVLRREAQKKRKQMPIRRLLSETGSLVQTVKPCFLMSPLSVSTFLDPQKISFDTVIFDEASQIFPQDAIGAIYRGKQLIVVGDSRQMPPTSFFSASTNTDFEDEEWGDINDFESILDVCSAVFDTERLSWHYRSHYEQLIAFSNLHFYNNGLVTFPSSSRDHQGIGVDYYHVDGVFDRKSKTNLTEARFIVDLVFRHIKEHPKRSLGVVAFSISQQNLIDKLLAKRREEDPSNEWFFMDDRAEPFFVKNLETVQGDERDTIIFSVAYARDSQGRFIQNFGPLNREGGERRLNVAVTRARDNVQLVASIHYTDIDLSKTESEGVRLLRAYLDYAQNGEQALERTISVQPEDHFDSYFEQEVCDFLRDQGFAVDTQIGCSGYRIDLGLRRPGTSEYVMAIECDGATYHRSKNARDRDRLRQQVLENMGWQFYRIWSTDWFRNKAVEKERLLAAAKGATARAPQVSEPIEDEQKADLATDDRDTSGQFVVLPTTLESGLPEFRQLDAMRVLEKHMYSLPKTVREIVMTEGPLSEEFLLKRIVSFFDREKVTKTVIDRYNRKMHTCESEGIIRRNGFLYLKDMDEIRFRVPGDRREIKYISLEELAEGFRTIIRQNVTVTKEGMYKAMTGMLGFIRTTESVAARYDEAMSLLKRNGEVVEADGEFSLPS